MTESTPGGRAADDDADRLSGRLGAWFDGGSPKSIGGLIETFGPDSFAVTFVVLMALPALPLPTGGVTHLLEIITMLLALELIAGRRTLWVPERWTTKELGVLANPKVRQKLVGLIAWLERWSRPRASRVLASRSVQRLYGLTTLVLAVFAFVSPPFSGLDTVPALGVVLLSLGMLLGDAAIVAVGALIGLGGLVLVGAILHFALGVV